MDEHKSKIVHKLDETLCLVMETPDSKMGKISSDIVPKSTFTSLKKGMDINDDGIIKIAASDQSKSDHAKSIIEEITAGPQVDKIYEGKVAKIMDFGAFVAITPNKDGLVHISQISEDRVKDVKDVLSEGDMVKVRVLEVDKQGRVKLTMKGIDQN